MNFQDKVNSWEILGGEGQGVGTGAGHWGIICVLQTQFLVFSFIFATVSINILRFDWPGRVAQSVGHLTGKSGVLGSIPGLATYFRFSFRFFMKGSCQLLAKVCARSSV